ncbi:MAG: glycosyltransferase family 2 protein, partial [Conexivisphaerales archaeon]
PSDSSRGEEFIVVPQDYSTPNGAIRKARALHYAVERRRMLKRNTSKYWVFHLDEESFVVPQTVLAILQFIREKKGLIAEGAIVYPIKFGQGNRLTALAESIRPFQCYDCTSQMTSPPPVHMHGSNLLVRADVEDHVGWDFPNTVAEDQLFGVRAYEELGNIFGWHGGMLLEQPPLSLSDHFRQRRRWIIGNLQNLHYLPTAIKLKIVGRLTTYLLGFASASATLALYLYYLYPNIAARVYALLGIHYTIPQQQNLPIATLSSVYFSLTHIFSQKLSEQAILSGLLGMILLTTSIAWLLSYQIGLYWNLKYTNFSLRKRLYYHLQQFIFSPIIGVIETLPGIVSVIQYLSLRDKKIEFQVIAK